MRVSSPCRRRWVSNSKRYGTRFSFETMPTSALHATLCGPILLRSQPVSRGGCASTSAPVRTGSSSFVLRRSCACTATTLFPRASWKVSGRTVSSVASPSASVRASAPGSTVPAVSSTQRRSRSTRVRCSSTARSTSRHEPASRTRPSSPLRRTSQASWREQTCSSSVPTIPSEASMCLIGEATRGS